MGLKDLTSALFQEVKSAGNTRRFEQAKARHAALAAYDTLAQLVLALDLSSGVDYGQRDAITRALIAEQQREPHPAWSSALLLAYYPMLSHLRHRVQGDALDGDDLEQTVVSTFLEQIARYPLEYRRDRTCMYLRQETTRAVFGRVPRA